MRQLILQHLTRDPLGSVSPPLALHGRRQPPALGWIYVVHALCAGQAREKEKQPQGDGATAPLQGLQPPGAYTPLRLPLKLNQSTNFSLAPTPIHQQPPHQAVKSTMLVSRKRRTADEAGVGVLRLPGGTSCPSTPTHSTSVLQGPVNLSYVQDGLGGDQQEPRSAKRQAVEGRQTR